MKIVNNFDVKGKRILVRCDFNVPLDKNGHILDALRIERSIPTIDYLVQNNAKVILMSHFGNPNSIADKRLSLSLVQEKLTEYLSYSVVKADDCIGNDIEQWIKREMQNSEVLLLENLRFHGGEKDNDLDFAQKLAKLGDIFINNAFSASHRKHASIVSVPRFLPSGIGFLFEKEIQVLDKILKEKKQGFVVIIGGAKLKAKILPIAGLLNKVETLLIGGKVANAFLEEKKQSSPSELKLFFQKIDVFSSKIKLPLDLAVLNDSVKLCRVNDTDDYTKVFDIGPETIELFSSIIKKAKVVVWAGPLGLTQDERFKMGTLEVANAILNANVFSIIGGGDTIAFLKNEGLLHKFSHISTGGSAMLEYLGNGTLPGIQAILVQE